MTSPLLDSFFLQYVLYNLRIYFPHQSLKRFTFCVKSSDLIFFMFGFSPIVNQFDKKINLIKPFTQKILFNLLKKCNYYVEILFKTRKCCPPPPKKNILFELDFNVKFPLLRLLQSLSIKYYNFSIHDINPIR